MNVSKHSGKINKRGLRQLRLYWRRRRGAFLIAPSRFAPDQAEPRLREQVTALSESMRVSCA